MSPISSDTEAEEQNILNEAYEAMTELGVLEEFQVFTIKYRTLQRTYLFWTVYVVKCVTAVVKYLTAVIKCFTAKVNFVSMFYPFKNAVKHFSNAVKHFSNAVKHFANEVKH